jgi:hypothetical protein
VIARMGHVTHPALARGPAVFGPDHVDARPRPGRSLRK